MRKIISINVIFIIIVSYFIAMELYVSCNDYNTGDFVYNNYDYQKYIDLLESQQDDNFIFDKEKDDYKRSVDREFGFPVYKLIYTNHNIYGNPDIAGTTIPELRLIIIRNDTSKWEFIHILSHELVHLCYLTHNDIYCEFMSFKLMYESGNDALRREAIWFGLVLLKGERETRVYDASYQVAKYLDELYSDVI